MSSRIESLKIKAKLLQKAKRKAGKAIPLKEAYEILATSAGFNSWREFKELLDATELFSAPHRSAYWNVWYASYEEAQAHLAQNGGFLLPHEKHFFICDIHYIESLGISAGDSDLALVGPNWVEPRNWQAWQRLCQKIQKC